MPATCCRQRIGNYFVYVYIPLPPMVVDALNAVDHRNGWYFWTGNGKPVTAVAHWQRALQSLFELAHVDGAHSHRFRDSFATLRHYRPWVKSLQDHLEAEVQKAWVAEAAAN